MGDYGDTGLTYIAVLDFFIPLKGRPVNLVNLFLLKNLQNNYDSNK